MSTPPNIEVFNYVVAEVFVRLYATFPVPTTINPLDIVIRTALKEQYEENSPQQERFLNSIEATVQFLIDEKFIRIAGGPQYLEVRGFQNVVLTSKGFALLQKTPEAIDSNVDRRSYISRLKSATVSGAKVVATESIGSLVAGILGAG